MEGGHVTLDKQAPPVPWRAPSGLQPNYARSENLHFGWNKVEFRVERSGYARTKTLLSEPLTESGWTIIWAAIVETYPDLAAKVAFRAASDIQNDAVWASRREMEQQRLEIEQQQKTLREGETLVASVEECVLLGGYGYDKDFMPGAACRLHFTERGIWVLPEGSWVPRFERSYPDTTNLEFSGPGIVKSGGGFVGGGFGLHGALDGMIVASVLNKLTTRTKIHTVIRYQASDLEAFFFHAAEAPEQLRIRLSGVLGRIRSNTDILPASATTDRLAALERLGKLHQDGVVTADEFAAMKRQILESS